ncbi:MAG: Flp family type IVb pilin [Sphingomonadales bacterium]
MQNLNHLILQAHILGRLLRDKRGTAAIEYGLLVGLIGLVLVVALESIGLSLRAIVDFITAAIVDAMGRGGVG